MATKKKKCTNCGENEVKGRALYCSPKCRKAASRSKVSNPKPLKKAKIATESTPSGPNYFVGIDPGAPGGDRSVEQIIDTETGEILNVTPTAETPYVPGQKVEATEQTLTLSRDDDYDEEAAYAAFSAMGMEKVEWVTTGIPAFDALTMIPRGRVTQIQGPYAVGKTTLCLNMIAGLSGQRVLYIDTEASLNPRLLVGLRINPANFRLWNDSAYIEDVYDVLMRALEKPQFDIIILDSMAATTTKTEAAGSATDRNIGQKALVVNKMMRIFPMMLKTTKTALVIINQEREVIGSYAPVKYTPGGMGIPYAASLMVALKTTKSARFPKSGPPFKGHTVTAEIIKSKVNDPWRKADFDLFYPEGDSSK